MAARDRVREIIERSGVKQNVIAERMGEPDYWLSNRLTGRTVIQADELPRLAWALGVQPTDLLDPAEPLPAASPLPAAFAQAFELEGVDRMLSDYTKLQDLSPYESAIVADLVDSLKRHRDQPSQ